MGTPCHSTEADAAPWTAMALFIGRNGNTDFHCIKESKSEKRTIGLHSGWMMARFPLLLLVLLQSSAIQAVNHKYIPIRADAVKTNFAQHLEDGIVHLITTIGFAEENNLDFFPSLDLHKIKNKKYYFD